MQAIDSHRTAESAANNVIIPNTPIRFLFHISKPFKWYALLVFFVVSVAQILSTAAPYVLKKLVDALTAAPEQESILAALTWWGGAYVILTVVTFFSWRLSGFLGVFWLSRTKAYSYSILFNYLLEHSHSYFSDRFAGSVANKVSHASDGSDNLLEMFVWHHYPSILALIGTNVLFYMTNLHLGVIFTTLIVLILILNIFLVRRRRQLVVDYANASSILRGVAVDIVTNITAVRHFSRSGFEEVYLGRYIDDRKVKDVKRDLSQEYGLAINNSIVTLFMFIMVVVLYGAVRDGHMTVGDVVLVISLLWSTSYQLIFIGNMLNSFIRTYGEIDEGLTETLIPHSIVDDTRADTLKVTRGEIVWNQVIFRYENQTVFEDFTLVIKPGERIGLVGPSGAGKTTFVSLLLRQHDLDGGSISIDGKDIAQVTQESLREQITVVPQEPLLFHRTIKENIAYGKLDAADEEIVEVAKKAQAHDFITTLPQGYETLVGERGVKLSGGQRQRVAIARAMLKNAPILILDEATSALDSESEVLIQKALHELMEGKTVIAIAHRLSTLREMDRIIVLERGKIVEDGSHTELIAKGGLYSRLWSHQAGGFLQE